MRLISSTYGRADAIAIRAAVVNPLIMQLPPAELYGILWRHFLNNQLYDDITEALRQNNQPAEDLRELRNPAHRVVEFHVAKMFPGTLPSALPILSPNNPRMLGPVHQIWKWSNFGVKKQLAARFCAMFGDMFLKVAERDTPEGRRVFMQVLDPRNVTDFATDELGDITYIRIDVPQRERVLRRDLFGQGGRYVNKPIMYTEVWDRTSLRIFKAPGANIRADEDLKIADGEITHGLGFVPIVWAPFADIGEDRGLGAFTHALSKIEEANRIATRLHRLLFRNNNNNWVLQANQVDATGRPLPAPRLEGLDGTDSDSNEIHLGDERVFRLPGNSSLASIIPAIDYNAALAILNAHLEELRNDLPELRYFDTTAKSHVSGVALRSSLADAVDRVVEARGNMEAALAKANAYALHMAQRAKLPAFSEDKIGRLRDGDFEHQFADRPVFPLTSGEQAGAVAAWVQTGVPLPIALLQEGWTPEEIKEVTDAQVAEVDRMLTVQRKQAEAAADLPVTEQIIATMAEAYTKIGVPADLALDKLGWTEEWLAKLKEGMDKAKTDALDMQAKQQEQQSAAQQQAQQTQAQMAQQSAAEAFAREQELQKQKLEGDRQLQAEKLAAEQEKAKIAAAAKPAPAAPKPPPSKPK